MTKHKGLTYEEHLENADDFAIIFHHLENISKRCSKIYPKTHKIMQKIMTLNSLQNAFTLEYYKVVTDEQFKKDEFPYYDVKNKYKELINK